MGSISLPTLISYGIAIFILLLIITAFKAPVKIIIKLILNVAIGLFALIIINTMGNYINIHLPVNVYTILTAGFLGIPGVVVIFLITRMF